MNGYCNSKAKFCDNLTAGGYCSTTTCINEDCYITFSSGSTLTFVRECQICGCGTNDLKHYICEECRQRLNELLYEK